MNRIYQSDWRKSSYHGLLLLLVAGLFAGCGGKKDDAKGKGKDGPSAPSGPPRVVQVTKAQMQGLERTVAAVGSLAAYEQATLGVKVSGRMQSVSVDIGTPVKKGQVIAQLEKREYEVKLMQAEALLSQARAKLGLSLQGDDDAVDPVQTSVVREAAAVLEEAKKNRERFQKLSKDGVSSQSELETVEAAYEVAVNRQRDAMEEIRNRQALLAQRRAEVAIAKQQLEETTVKAPFDGFVQERRATQGEYLIVGAPVATVVRSDILRLRLEVPEKRASLIKEGQDVRLTVTGDTNIYQGEIKRLSPIVNDLNRMLVVEADVPNPGRLRPGFFAQADIVANPSEPGLTVPADALVTFAGVEKVLTIKEGKALERPVTSGRKGATWVEILNGLKAGEAVVRNPGNLRTGEPVVIKEGKES
ncbi:MAG TPA: efflux RND transporter periplasmic adaptor subunit [Verrucomicrobiae bacterium]